MLHDFSKLRIGKAVESKCVMPQHMPMLGMRRRNLAYWVTAALAHGLGRDCLLRHRLQDSGCSFCGLACMGALYSLATVWMLQVFI